MIDGAFFTDPAFVVAVVVGAIGYGTLKGRVKAAEDNTTVARAEATRAHQRFDLFQQGVFEELRGEVTTMGKGVARIEGLLARNTNARTRESDE